MNLVRWNNKETGLSNIFDELINRDFFSNELFNYNKPSVNITESAKEFNIDVAIPGMNKKDFKINLEEDVLTISLEKEAKKEEKGKNYRRREFSYGTFSRSFSLPENIETEKINAKYEDGILKVNLPKKEESKMNVNKTIDIS